MSKVKRRIGNRTPTKSKTPIVVFVYGVRIEGVVIDQSDSGLLVQMPAPTGLTVQQPVTVLYQRRRQTAKIVRIELTDNGEHVGIRLATK